MIHIERCLLLPTGLIGSRKHEELVRKLLEEKDMHDFEKNKSHLRALSKNLKKLYNNKCGYCETAVNDSKYLHTDHYRPKKKLKDDPSHPGYYWLGYEWSNFLPLCPGCNGAKSNHFPIDNEPGKRIPGPPIVNNVLDLEACQLKSPQHLGENALLLHPELDNPEDHLLFHPDGRVEGKSLKGKVTIAICKLSRIELVKARKGVIDIFYKELSRPLAEYIKGEINGHILSYQWDIVFRKMVEAQQKHHPYTQVAWNAFQQFDTFMLPHFGKKSRSILKKAYLLFCRYGTCR